MKAFQIRKREITNVSKMEMLWEFLTFAILLMAVAWIGGNGFKEYIIGLYPHALSGKIHFSVQVFKA